MVSLWHGNFEKMISARIACEALAVIGKSSVYTDRFLFNISEYYFLDKIT